MERSQKFIVEDGEKKRHIVYLTNEFVTDDKAGGLATYLDNIVSIMQHKGHRVTVITLSESKRIFYYRKNIKVICIKKTALDPDFQFLIKTKYKSNQKQAERFLDLLMMCIFMLNSLRVYAALRKLILKEKVDIIHAASCGAIGFFRTYQVPTVLRASCDSAYWREACYSDFDYNRTMDIKTLTDKIELFCMKHADAVFAPSRCCANILTKRVGKKLSVIESPYRQHDIQMDDNVYRERLQGKKYLLFNSTLSMLKGTHLGIRAAQKLLNKYPNLYMVYAGIDNGLGFGKKAADVLKEQNRKYQGRVIYLGKLSQEQLFPVIQHALACVLPSRIDNLPNSCIEAMAFEKIVIGTYGASFEQLIRNKENGLLIQRDSVNALIKAVDYLMQLNDEERRTMGIKAKKTITRLKPDLIYGQLMEYYEKAIKNFANQNHLKRIVLHPLHVGRKNKWSEI